MTTSLVSHHATDGSNLFAIVSISAIKSLSASQVQALSALEIRRVSDLLHYKPIHDSILIVAAAKGQIAHDTSLTDLVDSSFTGLSPADLITQNVGALKSIDDAAAGVFQSAFEITTIEQLADFVAFKEAQQFLTPGEDVFREASSAPGELMPKMVGAVQSTATYSSFVREKSLRLKEIELAYDDARIHFVDQRLAGLFPVLGYNRVRHGLSPEPVLHLGYVCKHTQRWVNFGTFLGETVYSLALAPGESRNIATIDWTRSQKTTRSEDTTQREQLTNDLFHARALDEVTRSTASEHQSGGTSIAAGTLSTASANVIGAAVAGGVATALPAAALGAAAGAIIGTVEPGLGNIVGAAAGGAAGAVIGFGAGAAISGGFASIGALNGQLGSLRTDSHGDRKIEGSLRQEINEMISQKASAVRSLRSTIFVTDEQAEQEQLQTRNITNYNHSHMLNLEYYEVLQHYRAELRLTDAEPLLFLPFRPLDFTFEIIRDYWLTLRLGVTSKSLRDKFDRLIEGFETAEGTNTGPLNIKNITAKVTVAVPGFFVSPEVKLIGSPEIQEARAQVFVSGGTGTLNSGLPITIFANFVFQDSRPALLKLKGLSITGLSNSQRIGVAVAILAEDNEGKAKRFALLDDLVQSQDGIVTFNIDLGDEAQATTDAVGEIERYFDERRYFFTRLLLLSIEKEQLIDLIEALQFQVPVRFASPGISPELVRVPFGSFARPRSGPYASGQMRIISVALEILETRICDRLIDLLTANTPIKNKDTAVAAANTLVERIFSALWQKLRRSFFLASVSIQNVIKDCIKVIVDILIKETQLDSKQASRLVRTIGLEQELASALEEASRIPGIAIESIHLSEFIEPEPLAITGNTLMFRMRRVSDPDVLANEMIGKTGLLQPLVEQPQSVQDLVEAAKDPNAAIDKVSSEDVYLPTNGVFAEAILGRANASEKIDITRFFNWVDSPIPHLAPRIADVTAGDRTEPPLETTPTLPTNVLNIMTPPAFPDPTGLAASLAAIQNGNIFRDMSKTDALASVLANLSNLANQQGQLAGTLAGNAQKETLQSAVDFGNKIANLAAQSQSQETSQAAQPPQTLTEKGAVANKLDEIAKKSKAKPEDTATAKAIGAPISESEPSVRDVVFNFLFFDPDGKAVDGLFDLKMRKDGLHAAGQELIRGEPFVHQDAEVVDGFLLEELTLENLPGPLFITLKADSIFSVPVDKSFSGNSLPIALSSKLTNYTFVVGLKFDEIEVVASSETEALDAVTGKIEVQVGNEPETAPGDGKKKPRISKRPKLPTSLLSLLSSLIGISVKAEIGGTDSDTTTTSAEFKFICKVPNGGLEIKLSDI
jgi:hypothetical protein